MQEKKLQIIALGPNNWHGPRVNRQQILSRLGQKHDVLYSTGLWSVWDIHDRDYKASSWLGKIEKTDAILLDYSPKLLLLWPRWDIYSALLMRLAVYRWRSALEGKQNRKTVAYLFHPMFLPYIDRLGPCHIVYHAYDDFSKTPAWNPQLADWEKEVVKRASFVFTVTKSTADRLSKLDSNSNVHIIPNGVDFDAFSAEGLPEPNDLAQVPQPRVGYVGMVNRKVDFDLIRGLARRRPEWNFVFVGGVWNLDSYSRTAYDACKHFKNVFFLGHKGFQTIPSYVAHMDVNMMCYSMRPDLWVNAGYPLKMHEYLAVGKPVVSADLEAVRAFSHVVRIARTEDEWESALIEAVESGGHCTEAERRQVASENTWDARVTDIDAFLQKLV